jgi:hypothetical protein
MDLKLNLSASYYHQFLTRFVKYVLVTTNQTVPLFRFSTSRQTLIWIQDSFFTALLSNRIDSHKDETGALFIDRDPKLFSIILNYLRTKDIDLKNVDIRTLRHEAEYYGITPLVKRLMLCEDLTQSSCGDVLFYGYLPPPSKLLLQNYIVYHILQ